MCRLAERVSELKQSSPVAHRPANMSPSFASHYHTSGPLSDSSVYMTSLSNSGTIMVDDGDSRVQYGPGWVEDSGLGVVEVNATRHKAYQAGNTASLPFSGEPVIALDTHTTTLNRNIFAHRHRCASRRYSGLIDDAWTAKYDVLHRRRCAGHLRHAVCCAGRHLLQCHLLHVVDTPLR